MIYQLRQPLRRALAVSLVLLVIGITAALTVVPLTTRLSDLNDAIVQERTVIGRLQTATNSQEPLSDINILSEKARKSGLFIEGETEPIRLAALQSQLAEIINSNGVKPRSTRGLPSRDRNELHLVGSQLQIIAPIEKVQKILLDIEGHSPALLVDYLQITPSSMAGVSNEEGAADLDARFDVFAVTWPTKQE